MTGPEGLPTVRAWLIGFGVVIPLALSVAGVLWGWIGVVAVVNSLVAISLITAAVVIVCAGVTLLLDGRG